MNWKEWLFIGIMVLISHGLFVGFLYSIDDLVEWCLFR